MNALIPIAQALVGSDSVPTVNARELHAFLEIGKDFSNWIKDRIKQYGFAEGSDYVIVENLRSPESGSAKADLLCSPELASKDNRGGHNRKNYHLTLDMAKELSMVERNARGKQARQYFIACERQAKQAQTAPALPQTLPEALRLAADLTEQKQALEHTIAKQAPKVEGFDRIANAEGLLTLRKTAATLNLPEKKFILWLLQHRWLYRHHDRNNGDDKKSCLQGYAESYRNGWVEYKSHPYTNRHTGLQEVRHQVCITPQGLSVLARKLPAIQQDIAVISNPPLLQESTP